MARKKSIKGPFSYSPSDTDIRAMTGVPAGDYYGTGIKNPMGKIKSPTVGTNPVSKKGLKTPPKSVV